MYSLTRTEKSPLGYANVWASAIPLRPSTGTGRRARIPPCTACCSTMQYAYHAMRELLLSEKRLVGRRELFKNRAKFTAKSFYSARAGFLVAWMYPKLSQEEMQQRLCMKTEEIVSCGSALENLKPRKQCLEAESEGEPVCFLRF